MLSRCLEHNLSVHFRAEHPQWGMLRFQALTLHLPPLTPPSLPLAQPKSLMRHASNLIVFHCYQSPPPFCFSCLIKTRLYTNDHAIRSIQFNFFFFFFKSRVLLWFVMTSFFLSALKKLWLPFLLQNMPGQQMWRVWSHLCRLLHTRISLGVC